MVLSEEGFVMLLQTERFKSFIKNGFMYGHSFQDPDGHH